MIRTVCLNPALDKTVQVDGFAVDAVNRISDVRIDAGGKGINVSKVIKELGGSSKAYALLAGSTGSRIADMVGQLGIDLVHVTPKGETRTNLKVVDKARHTNTDINEPGPLVTSEDLEALLDLLLADLDAGDVVVLAGSLPKGAPTDTYARWIQAISEAGAQAFLDADGEVLAAGIAAGPALIKPNDHELADLVGCDLPDTASIVAAAHELMDKGARRVVVSLGGEGALFVTPERTVRARAPKVPVGSTVGAGDSVVAAVAVAQQAGLSIEETARLGVATGAANVMQSGTQAAPRSLVDDLAGKVTVEEL
ncbi:1-phosphofructokinase [Olsenella sp. HMSC062G07]|uniref:1-phosphofructokinase n=1 Tax=Olsenella sp. HMSC062G07 TaxID=1739330 RepID=UPI0008A5EA94|nr:1-phosphofructokinase [Olsenella sp. HMSC062G07]OFK23272.1 1-phosphofructokinase [Olsenella sp. HMSC062G07]